MIKFALIFVLCTGAFAQRPGPGKCPKVDLFENYKIQKALGRWYVYGRYFADFQEGEKCNKVDLSLTKSGNLKIVRTQTISKTGKTTSTETEAVFIYDNEEAVVVEVSQTPLSSGDLYYSIPGTDYTSFLVVFVCLQKRHSHETYAWIHTRERFPSEDTVRKALDVFDNKVLDKKYIKRVNQKDCK